MSGPTSSSRQSPSTGLSRTVRSRPLRTREHSRGLPMTFSWHVPNASAKSRQFLATRSTSIRFRLPFSWKSGSRAGSDREPAVSHVVAVTMDSRAPMTNTITTSTESETAAVGRELATTLSAGDVVLLSGDLGAGKTAFVKGLAAGLGVATDQVSSPTFTLVQEYRGGRLPLFHVDLYRLEDARELDDLGLDEIAADGVLAIEWAEKLPRPPDGAVHVSIEHAR